MIYTLSDTPFALAGAVFEAIPALAGTIDTSFDFSIFTGDLVSHDPNNELSRDYVMYTEVSPINSYMVIRVIADKNLKCADRALRPDEEDIRTEGACLRCSRQS